MKTAPNKEKKYRGVPRKTAGYKLVRKPLFARDIATHCDEFWRDRGIKNHIGDMQLCEP